LIVVPLGQKAGSNAREALAVAHLVSSRHSSPRASSRIGARVFPSRAERVIAAGDRCDGSAAAPSS
jgi:hypothetical protein